VRRIRVAEVEGRHIRVAEAVERHTAVAEVAHIRLGVEGRRIDQRAAVDTDPAVQESRTVVVEVLRSLAARLAAALPTALAGAEVHHMAVGSPAGEEDSFLVVVGHPNPVAEAARYTRTGPEAGAPGSILPGSAAVVRTLVYATV
jgi:hypothetical protein